MGGRIGVSSTPGEGAQFWIEIPLEAGTTAVGALCCDISLASVHVLVVDDNPTNREILQRQLEGWHMQVECAANGAEALERMRCAHGRGQPFALAVLDMHMPQMDGLQLANAIQAVPELATTGLIVLTSSYSSASVRERERAGILRCVHKPIRQAELHQVVCSALRSPRRPQAAAAISPSSRPGDTTALAGRVLLAEDNPTNQHVAQAMLAKLGVAVDVAGNGRRSAAPGDVARLRRDPDGLPHATDGRLRGHRGDPPAAGSGAPRTHRRTHGRRHGRQPQSLP